MVPGFYYDTLQSVSGCDSVLKTELLVDSIVNINISSQICQNDSILFGNIYLDTSGIYYDTVTNVSACDTIYIFDLQVNPLNINFIDSSVCSIYITSSGDTVSSSGVFYDTLSSNNGCDSIVTLNLSVISVPEPTIMQNGNTLSCDNFATAYQWLDCDDNYAPIEGATDMVFTATQNGSYALEITFMLLI